jgi:hypothetical protein
MGGQIEIDKMSRQRVMQSLQGLEDVPFDEALIRTLFKIKALAQLRIREKGHIVTSRLRNSLYVKYPEQSKADSVGRKYNEAGSSDNNQNYSWNATKNQPAGSGNRDLKTVNLKIGEGAVGTNVDYAGKIERMDSYLYWGAKNINKDVKRYFQDIVRNSKNKFVK